MKDLKKLKELGKSLLAVLEGLSGKIETAEAGGKADELKTLKAEYETKGKEFDALEADIAEAEVHARRFASVVRLSKLAEPEGGADSGKTIPEGSPAQAADHDKEDRELENHFADWFYDIGGKVKIPDGAMDALQPKGKGWKEAGGGLAVPKRLAKLIAPTGTFGVQGKALPLLSNTNFGTDLVQTEYKQTLQMYQGEGAALLPFCFVIPTKSGSVIWPALTQHAPGAEGGAQEFGEYGYVSCAWTAEGAEKPDSEALFEQRTYNAYELAAKTTISRTLLNRSAIDIEALLNGLFRASVGHKIDLALIGGNGVGKPLGILDTSAPATTIGTEARQVANEVSYTDLVHLQHGIPPQLRGGAVWILADDALESLKLETDAVGRPIMPINPQTGTYDSLLGRPYKATQRTALGALGDVTFGDFSQYIVPMEQEVVISKSEHRYAERGLILYVVFVQVGGRVSSTRAFRALAA
jgi:HK97 family phage major capsid protein